MSLMHSAQKYYPVLLSDGMGMQDYFDDAMQYLLADENRQANRYTLDEALKLYALYRMEQDVEAGRADEIAKGVN